MKLEAKDIRVGNLFNSKLLGTNHKIEGYVFRNNKKSSRRWDLI
jgi:hypothetical protein